MEKKEFLKLLPKLIREDDEIKGAIITALSGVVATKEDITRVIEHSNRRFEEINNRFEEINNRFEDNNNRFEEINKRFEAAAKERRDIQDSVVVLRETVGEVLQEVDTLKKDIKDGNNEILDYLREQFEQEE
jgi:methyl-accepting chemotaxis protein